MPHPRRWHRVGPVEWAPAVSSQNLQLAAIFHRMAQITEILGGDRFRINSFERASRALAELAEDVAAIGPDAKALQRIEGIGEGTARRIAEFLETGRIKDHDELTAKVPSGLLKLLDIQGLGPKKVAVLWKEAGIEDLASLKRKLGGNALADLPGFGRKTVENLRKNLAFIEQAGQRYRLGDALPMAVWIVEQLRPVRGVEQISYAGSLRRGRETIGDIDIVVAFKGRDRAGLIEAFKGLEVVDEVLMSGSTKTSVRTGDGMQVDLRIVEPQQYGAALMYFTGSKEHNVELRERAQKMGMTLNEYALSRVKDEKVVASKTEQEIYKALKLAWIPPELREARAEIALAGKGRLPTLIELADIRSELHTHTTASDGHWSIEELAACAVERGYHTVAITDHSRSQVQANGLSAQRLEKHIEAVRKVAAKLKGRITVLAGSEVDILADGALDYPNSLLKQLDIIVASPHAALSQEPKKATERLLKAIHNPYVTMLGHPTGRLINRREGLSPDMKRVIAAAAERGIALELNANAWRLDVRDSHARMAIEAGVKLSINTDAHGAPDLDQLIFGILTARRAGATAQDVINCMSRQELARWLAATRG